MEAASAQSVWRGYDYFKEKKVLNIRKVGDGVFAAEVQGNRSAPYAVELDIDHPRRSKCSCPHANGRRIVCKHAAAVYFAAFPEEAERFYAEQMAYEEEAQRREEELEEKLERYIAKMKKTELQ